LCWQKEEDRQLPSIRSFDDDDDDDDDDLWRSMEDLMMHGKCWRLKECLDSRDTLET